MTTDRNAQPPNGRPPSAEEYVADPGRWRILAVLLVSIFMSLVAVSIINVVLPSVQHGLDASDSDLQWVLSGYALTFGVVLVAAGRAGDILGRGPLFIIGVVLFSLSSVAAGLAPDPTTLNIARVVQGLGSGLLNPQAVGMIQQYFRGAERGRAYGALGSVVGISVAIGPLLGGLIIEMVGVEHGWRWTFLVNVPVGIVAIVLALRWFPRPMRTPRVAGTRTGAKDLDPVGAMLLGLAVLSLLLPFVERQLGLVGWLLVPVGIAFIGLWLWWERRHRDRGQSPMVDLALFRIRSFSVGTLIATLYFLGVTSVWVLVAMYVQNGLGRTALVAGLVGLPAAGMSAISAHWSGRRVTVQGRRIVILGILAAILGMILSVVVVQLVERDLASMWWLLLTLGFIGTAQGLVITPNQTLTLLDVPLEYSGSAGGVLQTGQRIGTAMGLAVITGATFAVLAVSGWTTAFSVGFGLVSLVLVVTLAVAVADHRGPRRPRRAATRP